MPPSRRSQNTVLQDGLDRTPRPTRPPRLDTYCTPAKRATIALVVPSPVTILLNIAKNTDTIPNPITLTLRALYRER